MRYQVVEGDTMMDLENSVNDQIDQGWRPLGGVCVVARGLRDHGDREFSSVVYYYQAMTSD